MSSNGNGPEPLVDPTGRYSLRLFGDYVPARRRPLSPEDDIPSVLFALNVEPPYRTRGRRRYVSGWYQLDEFRLTRLSELREKIINDVGLDVLPFISDDEHELHEFLEFLSGLVATYIYEGLEGMMPLPVDTSLMYRIRAQIQVLGQGETAARVTGMFRKVTYHINEEELEDEASAPAPEMVRETRCAICLKDFGDGAEVHLTPCGHPFHLLCLERSMQYRRKCPLCRDGIP